MKTNDRYEVKEEELPSDEYDNEVNHWYVYDNETDTVVDNEWFDTEKRAHDYLNNFLLEAKNEKISNIKA
jgi:IS1 family transposase